jgi:hypothetical protein
MRIPPLLIVALGLAALSNAADGGCDAQKRAQNSELNSRVRGQISSPEA